MHINIISVVTPTKATVPKMRPAIFHPCFSFLGDVLRPVPPFAWWLFAALLFCFNGVPPLYPYYICRSVLILAAQAMVSSAQRKKQQKTPHFWLFGADSNEKMSAHGAHDQKITSILRLLYHTCQYNSVGRFQAVYTFSFLIFDVRKSTIRVP